MSSLIHDLAATFLRLTKKRGPSHDPVAFRRRFLAEMPREPGRAPSWIEVTERAGLTCYEYSARSYSPERSPVILYLPGGSYSSPIHRAHLNFGRRLADALGARIVFALYPLAPEHTWRDSREALIELAASLAGQAPRLIVAGDSAGGGYALSVVQGVRDAGGPPPEKLVLISPWLDLTGSAPGIESAAQRDPWLQFANLSIFAGWWAGADDVALPQISPGLGSLEGLPPTLALCGTRDLLHPENRALAERARQTDWDYHLITAPDLIHVYPILPVPEAKLALNQIVGFAR